MAFSFAPYFGKRNEATWRYHAEIATKIRAYLGLATRVSVYAIRFEIWAFVVWVYVPGFRPRFISRSVLGV